MNDQSQLMNQHQVIMNSLMMNQSQMTNHSQMMKRSQLVMNRTQMMNPLNQSQMVNQPPPMTSQPQMVNQLSQQQMRSQMSQQQMMAQPQMVGQNYGQWPQLPPNMPPMNTMKFPNHMKQMQMFGMGKAGRGNWKGKKVMDKRKDMRRKDKAMSSGGGVGSGSGVIAPSGRASAAVSGGYRPPTLNELEHQNRLKARRFYHKKNYKRMGPYAHAPRNTTSFIIRAKKSGGIASLVSPCPVTPAVLPTPVFSPSREALVDMAKEEWGVDGYGSMKGLIRLRSPGHEVEVDDYEEEEEDGSSESDVEEHVEVERRLDHDLSRFEMIYPNCGADYNNLLENRVDDQDTHIAQLEEENLILKERLYLMESELGDLRRRLLSLERHNQVVEDIHEEVVENVSENESEGLRDLHLHREKHYEDDNYVPRDEQGGDDAAKGENNDVLHNGLTAPADGELVKGTHNELKELEKDIALPSEQPVFDVLVENKDKAQGNALTGETYMQEGKHERGGTESKNNLDPESKVEANTDSIEMALKAKPAVDVCMGDTVPDKVSENFPSGTSGNEGVAVEMKAEGNEVSLQD